MRNVYTVLSFLYFLLQMRINPVYFNVVDSSKTFRFKEKPPDALEAENFRQMSTEHLLSEVFEVRMKEWGKLLQKNVKK